MGKVMDFVEHTFGRNDYFVIITVLILFTIMYFLPKRFPQIVTCLILLFGLTVASVLDNSLAIYEFDFYDIMDGPAYSFMDIVMYLLYMPFGYFFLYLYDQFQLRGKATVLYIFGWSILAVGFEALCSYYGVFHYKKGYEIYYSFPVYLCVMPLTIAFFHLISSKDQPNKN